MIVRNSPYWQRRINQRGGRVCSISPINFDWKRPKWLRVIGYPPRVVGPTLLSTRSLWMAYDQMVMPRWHGGMRYKPNRFKSAKQERGRRW